MSGDTTYATTFRCENCGDEKFYYPRLGIDIKTFLKTKECTHCGCDLIQKKEGGFF